MKPQLARALSNVAAAKLEGYHWLMDITLETLLWYADLRGHQYSVQDYVGWDRIPDVYARQIAVTWIRKGRVMSRPLRAWLAVHFGGENPTLHEIVEAALRRHEPERQATLNDLLTLVEFIAEAHPLEATLAELVPKVHAAHTKAKQHEQRTELRRAPQLVLF